MFKWQDKCYQFLLGKGLSNKEASHQVFNFVRDNMDKDFHFDVDTRITESELIKVLGWLTVYYNTTINKSL
jgi:hypothetical protein